MILCQNPKTLSKQNPKLLQKELRDGRASLYLEYYLGRHETPVLDENGNHDLYTDRVAMAGRPKYKVTHAGKKASISICGFHRAIRRSVCKTAIPSPSPKIRIRIVTSCSAVWITTGKSSNLKNSYFKIADPAVPEPDISFLR